MSYVSGDQAITNDLQIYMAWPMDARCRPFGSVWSSGYGENLSPRPRRYYTHTLRFMLTVCVADHFSGPDVAIGPD